MTELRRRMREDLQLAGYVHRVAITNNSIIAMENEQVTFRYQNATTRQWKTMPLPAMEFLLRFLQHVLPKGFHKVRYYGFLHPANKVILKRLQLLLMERDRKRTAELEQEIASRTETLKICPCCKVGIMMVVERLPRRNNQSAGNQSMPRYRSVHCQESRANSQEKKEIKHRIRV